MNLRSSSIYPLGLAACAATVVGFLVLKESSSPPASPDPGTDNPSLTTKSRLTHAKSSRPRWTGAKVTSTLITSMWVSGSHDELLSAFDHWLKKSPQDAIAFLESAKPPIVRSHFSDSLSQYLLTLPHVEAMTLMAPFRPLEQDFHRQVCLAIYREWNTGSPNLALEWLIETGQTFLAREIGRTAILGEHGDQLPQLVSLPKSETRDQLVTGALESWLASDADEAITYLNEAEASPAFDQATFSYLDTFISKDPGAAKIWAENLINPELRSMALQEVAAAVRNACPNCQSLYRDSPDSTKLRQPIDLHSSHSH